ncbi:amidase [Clostridium sp. AL.422]|uniref:amidase n=1 Tax=Clostridium TaxID=1485 RepID=UPI00293DC7D3|nr:MULTISPECIES: amidase [unclassified Clostridium]MDV4150405.1 amidase [Clostridium sp. AL.422]
MDKDTKIFRAKVLAEQNLYRSVVSINNNLEIEAKEKIEDVLTFGVKNTVDIPVSIVDKLMKNSKYLFLSVDKMSHLGRSIDTDLVNPLTYRCMTGSSSGTAINIIKGINDFGIGTDGGGSVLAPAISTNLYSFIGSGVNLVTGKGSLSTDNISFSGGIGIISKNLLILKEVVEDILEEKIKSMDEVIRIVIPKENSLKLPDGSDMREEIDKAIENLDNIRFQFIDYNFDNIYERSISIKEINNIFDNDLADIILTYEGPIDVYGYDETIQRNFKGIAEKEITSDGGKALVKAINMCKCTGITIPGEKLASGFVICGKHGREGMFKAFDLAEELDSLIEKNQIFQRYFIRRDKFVEPIKL